MEKQIKNYLTGEWIFFSSKRLERPRLSKESGRAGCPFCPENCGELSDAVFESENVTVVLNKYPAISAESGGSHEVLIESRGHDEKLAFFSTERITEVLRAIQFRVAELSRNPAIKYVQVFKNEGPNAGASIYHSHFQILASPALFPRQRRAARNFKKYFEERGACYICDSVTNIVYENEGFTAYAPADSMYGEEIDIAPKACVYDFRKLEKLEYLAESLKIILNGYYKKDPDFNYNLSFQISPVDAEYLGHLFIQVIPRKVNIAGFEFSTGAFINSTDPAVFAKDFKKYL